MLLRTLGVLALVLNAQLVVAQDTDSAVASLRGLRSVTVHVLFSTGQGVALQLDTVGLRAQTELELRRAGILVEPSSALLVVTVGVVSNSVSFAYHVHLTLRQWVSFLRHRVFATTWELGSVSISGRDDSNPSAVANNIAGLVHSLTERFLNDYLAANPPRR